DANGVYSVALYDGSVATGTLLGSTTTFDASGNWSISSGSPLADGQHTLTALCTANPGNQSPQTPSVTIDHTNPSETAIALAAGSDSGHSGSDDLTNVQMPTIQGNATDANGVYSVALYDGSVATGTLLGSTTTFDASGNWTISSGSSLADGQHTLTALVTDNAGNQSTQTLSVTIDTTAPTV